MWFQVMIAGGMQVKEFFNSRRFKLLIVILFLLLGFIVGAARIGWLDNLPSQIVGVVTAPIRKLSTTITNSATSFLERFTKSEAYFLENEELKEENRLLREQLIEYENFKRENEQLRDLVGIQEQEDEQELVPARVINRDPTDMFYSFTIDQGSLNGISVGDPVRATNGLVGIVASVNYLDAKVITLLNPSIDVGAYAISSLDGGFVKGELELAEGGLTRMFSISISATIGTGDIIITSGVGGVYPKGIPIGTILEVNRETAGTSMYAIVEPVVDVTTIKEVFVITAFRGQGGIEEEVRESQEVDADGSNDVSNGSDGTQGESGDTGADGDVPEQGSTP